jgi:hypothetical protein
MRTALRLLSDGKVAGVDRGALRGGEAVARDGEDEAQDTKAGELRGPGRCLRAENVKRIMHFGGAGPAGRRRMWRRCGPNKSAAPPQSPEVRRVPTITCSVPWLVSTLCGLLGSSS